MFESLQATPADPILGLITEHRNDARAQKIDLGVGVYRNAAGQTPVLDVVKIAERQLLETQTSKAYIGTAGEPQFNASMQALVFADSAPGDRVATLQTPGGSGSLRVAAGLFLLARTDATVWVSEPTWNNHVPLLSGAGLVLKTYPYYDLHTHTLRIDALLETLRAATRGDIVLLHACCHNPSGLDPTRDHWQAIADVLIERELVPFIDMAYQGFATDLGTDAFAIRHLADKVPEMIVSSSCSKNFGLYRDRVGTISVLAANAQSLAVVASQANAYVRTLYSLPPDHGAAVVSIILRDAELRAQWQSELYAMRDRVRNMRVLLNDALKERLPEHDFSQLTRATGMFCFLGVSAEQVGRLKKEFGVYLVDSSRINVAGITAENVDYLADAIATVAQQP